MPLRPLPAFIPRMFLIPIMTLTNPFFSKDCANEQLLSDLGALNEACDAMTIAQVGESLEGRPPLVRAIVN